MKKPLCVTFLSWSVFLLTAWSVVRLLSAVLWWESLGSYLTLAERGYLVTSALAWFIAGGYLSWAIASLSWKAPRAATIAALAFAGWYWLDRIWLRQPGANWGFSLGATLLVLTCVILCARHAGTRAFFRKESYGETSQNRKA